MRLAAALLLFVAVSAARAQEPVWIRQDATALTGTWSGVYDCSQGPTAVRLTLTGDADGRIEGTFAFSATRANPDVPSGAYSVIGALYLGGRVVLLGNRWQRRPTDYVMVDFDGWSDFESDLLRGVVCGNAVTISRR